MIIIELIILPQDFLKASPVVPSEESPDDTVVEEEESDAKEPSPIVQGVSRAGF